MRPLRDVVLEVTNACNLRCGHCGSTSGRPRADELSFEEIARILREVRALGCEELTVIGGEALIRPDWSEIGAAVVDLGMRLVLITNGLLIGEPERARLRELRPFIVGVSVDGASPETYRRMRGVDGFDRVMDLLHRLCDDGHPNVNAITTFTRANLGELERFAELFDRTPIVWQVQLANMGGERFRPEEMMSREDYAGFVERMRAVWTARWGTLRLSPMDDFGYHPLDATLASMCGSWRGCMAGREVLGIRSNGDVLGCLSLGDGFVEANLRLEPLERIWRSETLFSRFRRKRELLTGECAHCAHGSDCLAGCSAMASSLGELGCNPYCIRSIETERLLQEIASI
ncbi:MAG TPA: hypothetical protein DFS52_25900 [Myxococcales bacterium]|jgi:radical SAM protein with 4Fe4S-binding SPASM domain|nr:hypothetical protein [Myxococcales bacterium]